MRKPLGERLASATAKTMILYKSPLMMRPVRLAFVITRACSPPVTGSYRGGVGSSRRSARSQERPAYFEVVQQILGRSLVGVLRPISST